MKRKRGFSLIELICVIGIIALLAAVAIPSYQSYKIKSKVDSALTTLNSITQVAMFNYTNGTLTASTNLAYGGVSIQNNAPTLLNASNSAGYASFIAPGQAPNVPSNAFMVCVFLTDLNYTGFVAPSGGSTGTGSRMCIQYTENVSNGSFSYACGQVDGTSPDIPMQYLPSTCNSVIW